MDTSELVKQLNAQLLQAASEGLESRVRHLVSQGAEIECRDDWVGRSPLHHSSFKGHANVVEALLGLRASVEANDFNFGTPLHLAALQGHTETVQLLIQFKASINAQNAKGDFPIDGSRSTEVYHLLSSAHGQQEMDMLSEVRQEVERPFDAMFQRHDATDEWTPSKVPDQHVRVVQPEADVPSVRMELEAASAVSIIEERQAAEKEIVQSKQLRAAERMQAFKKEQEEYRKVIRAAEAEDSSGSTHSARSSRSTRSAVSNRSHLSSRVIGSSKPPRSPSRPAVSPEKRNRRSKTRDSFEKAAYMDGVEAKYVSTEELTMLDQPVEALNTALTDLKKPRESWKDHFEALDVVRRLVAFHSAVLKPELRAVLLDIRGHLLNLRSSVVKNALMSVRELACSPTLRRALEVDMDALMPLLLRVRNAFLEQEAALVVDVILKNCSLNKTLPAVMALSTDKNSSIRAKVAQILLELVRLYAIKVVATRPYASGEFLRTVGAFLREGAQEIRKSGRLILSELLAIEGGAKLKSDASRTSSSLRRDLEKAIADCEKSDLSPSDAAGGSRKKLTRAATVSSLTPSPQRGHSKKASFDSSQSTPPRKPLSQTHFSSAAVLSSSERKERRSASQLSSPALSAGAPSPRSDKALTDREIQGELLARGWIQFECLAQPAHYLRQKSKWMKVSALSTPRDNRNATFRAVAGLSGAALHVSIESKSSDREYLHFNAGRVKVEPVEQSATWRKDASWRVRPALHDGAGPDAISLEFGAKPGYFLRCEKSLNLTVVKTDLASLRQKALRKELTFIVHNVSVDEDVLDS